MGSAAGHGTAVAPLGPAGQGCCPQGGTQGGAELSQRGPAGLTASPPSERLLKPPLEGLQESLQALLSQAWAPVDIAVLKQLQASMAKLCRRISDLPPSSPRGGRSRGLLLTPPPGQ